ncbi:hypothetical protein B566_EDAN009964 [Ephemera danica]|nr:hypothetical protein B566_EDAN009964 [Ephemera danica]
MEISRVNQALKMLKLQELDRFYSHRSRPRFGKRSDEQAADMEDGYDQGSDEALKQLWRRDVSSR